MGVSLRRRHSFDEYRKDIPVEGFSRRRVSELRAKWASTSQLQPHDQCDAGTQVDEVPGTTSKTLPSASEDKCSGDEKVIRSDDEASSNRNPDDDDDDDPSAGWNAETLSRCSSTGFIAMCNLQRLDVRGRFEGWELKRSEIQLKKKLGQGDGGVIHFAKWRGLKCVAKMLRTESEHGERPRISPAVARQDLVNEITVLSHLRHPNLVLFLGACSNGEPLIILNEFLPGGNLEEFIHRTWMAKAQWKPSSFQVLQWGSELARALSFLHNCTTPVVHRDLKPANLLLDADLHLKVCDFGLSKLRELQCVSGTYKMTGQTGSLRYMAPEVFQHDPSYDERVDLYSAGMILWFIATGVRPFDRVSASSVARKAARDGLRPDLQPVKDKHSLALAAVISRCWAHKPEDRPSAMQLVRDLELQQTYLAIMKEEGYKMPVALKLEAHSLFHQALVGPCNIAQPPMWRVGRFGERAKWRAWEVLGDMRRDVALDQLNLLLDDYPTWRTKSHRTITTGPDGDRHAEPSERERSTPSADSSASTKHETPYHAPDLLPAHPPAPDKPEAEAEGGEGGRRWSEREGKEGQEEAASAHSNQTTASAKSHTRPPTSRGSSGQESGGEGDGLGSSSDSEAHERRREEEEQQQARRRSGSKSQEEEGEDGKVGSLPKKEDIARVAAMLEAVERDKGAVERDKGAVERDKGAVERDKGAVERLSEVQRAFSEPELPRSGPLLAEAGGKAEEGEEAGEGAPSSTRSLPVLGNLRAAFTSRRTSAALANSPRTWGWLSPGKASKNRASRLGGGWGAMAR